MVETLVSQGCKIFKVTSDKKRTSPHYKNNTCRLEFVWRLSSFNLQNHSVSAVLTVTFPPVASCNLYYFSSQQNNPPGQRALEQVRISPNLRHISPPITCTPLPAARPLSACLPEHPPPAERAASFFTISIFAAIRRRKRRRTRDDGAIDGPLGFHSSSRLLPLLQHTGFSHAQVGPPLTANCNKSGLSPLHIQNWPKIFCRSDRSRARLEGRQASSRHVRHCFAGPTDGEEERERERAGRVVNSVPLSFFPSFLP